ncbi:MAG TPA: hypothetical protein VF062_25270 [Candidatus Limnocylindrales bacterium]
MSPTLECLEPVEDRIESQEAGRRPGRRFVLMASATAFIAGLASLVRPSPAAADCFNSPCCVLGSCTWCPYTVSPDRFFCTNGFIRTSWMCATGAGTLYWCGECASGSSCHDAPFQCSIYFRN